MFMGVLLEEVALGMEGPEGWARADVANEAQGESGPGGKRLWAPGVSRSRMGLRGQGEVADLHTISTGQRPYSRRHPVHEALSALPRNGPYLSQASQRVPESTNPWMGEREA